VSVNKTPTTAAGINDEKGLAKMSEFHTIMRRPHNRNRWKV
jgi:hypothetical protein